MRSGEAIQFLPLGWQEAPTGVVPPAKRQPRPVQGQPFQRSTWVLPIGVPLNMLSSNPDHS